MADPKGEQLLDRLREYVQEQGGELAPGWRVEVKKRNSGTSAGTSDAYYFNPAGQRFRSRQEIVRHLETAALQSKKVTRQEAASNAREAAEKLGKQLPLTLDNGVTVARLGSIDARPSYHSQTQLWPVGYQASWQDAAVGTFQCNILEGGDEGPHFAVSLASLQADHPAQSLVEARDIETAWQELAGIQQAGLDAALAAQSKARKPTSCTAAPTLTAGTPAELPPEPRDSNGHAEGSMALPDQEAAGQTGNGPEGSVNGHLASEENQAANRQMSGSASMPATSMSKDQKPECGTKAAQPSLGEPDTASMPNGSHAGADATAEQPEEVDEAAAAKRQVLIKAAPLAGVWGLERFGFADTTVLRLLEALPGVEEHCKEYRYVEQRQGWEAEQMRLRKELEKHNKQATKASKGVEKKGAKLLSIEATAKVKAAQAEARQEAKAAAKRKRQEDKQAEKAELKRAKTEQEQEQKSAKAKPEQGSASRAAARAPASSDAKPKPRAKSGMDKTERDVHHVLYKVVGQVERQYNRDVEKAAAKAEKEAAKAQRHREREEQRQAKQAAAEHSKPRREATAADAAMPSQHTHTTGAAALATDVEDSMLPGFAKQLPPADSIGTGLLSPQQTSGLIEVREFLARFVDQPPHLADLEAAFANPNEGQHHTQLLTDVHLPLLELVVEEAFEAAIDVAGQENLDVRLHEMRYAMPPLKGDSWPELVRRYFALAATAAMVKSTEASGGLDTALGALVGATPLSLLGPFAVLQSLTAGAHTGEPTDAGAARLPLGASRTAPEASQVKQDAAALAAAENMLAASGGGMPQDEAARKNTIITCRRMLLELASIKGPKVEGGHASARSLSFDAQSAAAAARSGVPIDLMTVAARVDAGVYCNNAQGVEAFAANVQSVCDLFRAASRRSNSSFASELASKGVPAMADLISARMDKLMSQHHGLAVPDQAPTPGKKLKKGGSAESSPGSSPQPGSRDEKAVNIVEDLARPFAPWEGCCVCWEDEDRKHILLCDKCDAEYHTYCLDPPLEEVPEGEWFCPRCRSELEVDSSDQPIHASLVPTRLMKQEDCYRSLAAALGQQEYQEMTAQQRVQIAVLLCSLATSAASTRTQLTDAEDSRKDMRKEQLALKTKLRREEKERAAAAAADAAEAQSAPAAEGKEAADKAAKKLEGNARTRAKQQADAAAELQRDLARIEELTTEIRKCSLRKDMLGYDRHWSRYWLLEGSCPAGVTADESPAACWVYVERCHFPPGEKQQHRGSPDDEEEDLPLGQLAQQAQHGEESPQRAKRRKVQIPEDQGDAVSWGCYKTVEHVSKLIDFLNTRGVRESQLQKALLRVRPKLPTEASLAAAAAAATAAAAAAQEAKQKAMETAHAQQASTVPAVAKPDTQHETHSLVKTDPSPQIDPPVQTDHPALAADMTQKPSSGAVPPPGAVATALEAGAVPDVMGVDMPDVTRALNSKVEPAEAVKTAEAAPSAELDQQPSAELPLSDLEKCRLDLGAAANSLPPEAFDPVCGSEARQQQWQLLVARAKHPQELMAATLLLESMLRGERFKPHWRICNMPAPSPNNAGSFAAVRMRLQALRSAIKKTVSGAAGAAAVTREAAREAAAGGGGYSFRGRKAAGALAEPSPEDSAEEEAAPAAAKPRRAGIKRGRAATKNADGVNEDEALARRLQEQEDALATRGRATRGALRVPQKPSQAAQKGPSRDARHARGSASAGVRSSGRLKPQPAQGKQRPVTRGATEMRTTRSRAQEETYSSSEEDKEADSASEPESSELESSPASSAQHPEPQDQEGESSEAGSGSDHGSAAAQDAATKKGRGRASAATRSSRDSSLGRGSSAAVLETKAVEGRRRLRKAS